MLDTSIEGGGRESSWTAGEEWSKSNSIKYSSIVTLSNSGLVGWLRVFFHHALNRILREVFY